MILGLWLALAGCAAEADPTCASTELAGLGEPCQALGECAQPSVCATESQMCALPQTMTGEDGNLLTLFRGELSLEIEVELASSDLARTRGLGQRPCQQPDWGMLLVWPSAEVMSITVQAMRYDLDIAFVDEAGVVIDVRHDVPKGSKALYQPREPAIWVLEVPAGDLEGVEVGWQAQLAPP